MKKRFFLVLSMLVQKPISQIESAYFCNMNIGLSDIGEDVEVKFSLVPSSIAILVSIEARIINEKGENLVYQRESEKLVFEQEFKFVISKKNLEFTNECYLKAIFSSGSEEIVFNINRKEKVVIDPLQQSFYQGRDDFFAIDRYGKSRQGREIINFLGFSPLIDVNTYLFFDISCLRINYENEFDDFSCESINLFIKGEKNLFPKLPYNNQDQGYCFDMALQYDESDNNYLLVFNENFYVDPSTQMMSNTLNDGFIKTQRLFLPKNDFSNNKYLDFKIVISELGSNDITINYEATIGFSHNLIGENGDFIIENNCSQTFSGNYNEVIR